MAAGGTEAERVTDALDKLGRDSGSRACCWRAARAWPGSFLDAGEVDEMRIFIAPIAVGGRARPRVARGRGLRLDRARAPRAIAATCSIVGEDVLLEARLEEW